jgi:hypothetical protein
MNSSGSDKVSVFLPATAGWIIGLALSVKEFVRGRVRNSSIAGMAMVHEEMEDSGRFESHR